MPALCMESSILCLYHHTPISTSGAMGEGELKWWWWGCLPEDTSLYVSLEKQTTILPAEPPPSLMDIYYECSAPPPCSKTWRQSGIWCWVLVYLYQSHEVRQFAFIPFSCFTFFIMWDLPSWTALSNFPSHYKNSQLIRKNTIWQLLEQVM